MDADPAEALDGTPRAFLPTPVGRALARREDRATGLRAAAAVHELAAVPPLLLLAAPGDRLALALMLPHRLEAAALLGRLDLPVGVLPVAVLDSGL